MVDRIDFCSNTERHVDDLRDLDRPVDALLRRYPAQEGQIRPRTFPEREVAEGNPVVEMDTPSGVGLFQPVPSPPRSRPIAGGDGRGRNEGEANLTVHLLG